VSSLRPGWVPSRTVSAPDGLPSAGRARAADGGPVTTDRPRPPRLERAHVAVAAVVTAVALLGTVVVLGNAQPAEQVVPIGREGVDVAGAPPTGDPDVGALTPPGSASGPSPESASMAVDGNRQGTAAEPGQSAQLLVVHVVGEVARPGVVRLEPGARVVDAVEAAGGSLRGADLSTVNLARLLADGEQVRVGLPPDDSVTGVVGGVGEASGVVNVNQAGADQLVDLPGIGPVLAERIVAYRRANGPFVSVDQLLEVAGIGPAVLEAIHERVRL